MLYLISVTSLISFFMERKPKGYWRIKDNVLSEALKYKTRKEFIKGCKSAYNAALANGWIDENDSVFSKLKVWTKDENGNDYLIDLKKADVGAIYLSNADTQFSLKDDENNLNAEIKKTGIRLKL